MSNKNKLVICTVGTSLANECPSQRELLSKPTNWDDDTQYFEKEIDEKIQKTPAENQKKLSAEINSIDRLGISKADMIVLLSSDNAPGKACANSLQKLISNRYEIPNRSIELISADSFF